MALTNHAGTLKTFWRLIESYGHQPEPLFKTLLLDINLAEDPNARIPYSKVEALWKATILLVNDPYLGLKIPSCWHPSAAGSLGYAWLSSSSLKTAFERLIRFTRVITDGAHFRIEENNDEFSIIQSFSKDTSDIPEMVDAQLALLVNLCRLNYSQNLNPLAISFTHSATKEPGEYFSFFRCPVFFDSLTNKITFTQAQVNKILISDNPMLAQLNDQIMVQYLARLNDNNLIEKVENAIIEQLPSGKLSEKSIANSLYMSNRTFHRKLQQSDTSFRIILNNLRYELAGKYIKDSSLSLNEVSFLLGFSEISSFSRAFKRWTGSSPRAYRESH